jgi:hypothetical protein
MSRNRKIDPRQSDDKAKPPPTPHRDPIEPDPTNPKPEAPQDSESKPEERPDLDWAEHED